MGDPCPTTNLPPILTLSVATTAVGVILPRVREIAGVDVAFDTVPDTPLAVVTETDVTVPPLVALSVPPDIVRPLPIVISCIEPFEPAERPRSLLSVTFWMSP